MDLCFGRTERIKRLSPAGEYNCICDLDKTGADPRAITTILLVSLINAVAPQNVNERTESGWARIFQNTPYLTDHHTCNQPRRNHRASAACLRCCKSAAACRRPFHLASRPMTLWDDQPLSGVTEEAEVGVVLSTWLSDREQGRVDLHQAHRYTPTRFTKIPATTADDYREGSVGTHGTKVLRAPSPRLCWDMSAGLFGGWGNSTYQRVGEKTV